MKILIVDDSIRCKDLLVIVLGKYGKCETASNGKEAVEAFKSALDGNNPYDLIYIDICMPIMDGYEAITLIRQYEQSLNIIKLDTVKIVVVSALTNSRSIDKILIQNYLIKPINVVELIQITEHVLLGKQILNK